MRNIIDMYCLWRFSLGILPLYSTQRSNIRSVIQSQAFGQILTAIVVLYKLNNRLSSLNGNVNDCRIAEEEWAKILNYGEKGTQSFWFVILGSFFYFPFHLLLSFSVYGFLDAFSIPVEFSGHVTMFIWKLGICIPMGNSWRNKRLDTLWIWTWGTCFSW